MVANEFDATPSAAENPSGRDRRKLPLRAAEMIGTLSVALGVGSALASMPIAAAEDTDAVGAADSASQSPSTRDSRGPARTNSRTGQADSVAPEPSPPASTGRAERKLAPPAGTAVPARPNRLHRSGPAEQPLADIQASSATPDSAADRSVAIPVVQPSPAGAAAPTLVAVGVRSLATERLAAQAPMMTVAPARGSLSAPGDVLSGFLTGGGDPGTPGAAPLAWAALALSRRDRPAVASVPGAAASNADPAVPGQIDQLKDVLTGQVRGYILGWGGPAAVADAIAPLVAEAAADWISNGTVGPELTALASDPVVTSFISGWTAQQLTDYGVPPAISGAIGDAVSNAVRVVAGDPANTALIGTVDAFIGAVPWTSAPLSETLSDLLSADTTILDLVRGQLGGAPLRDAATVLLADPAVPQAIGTAVTTAIRDLAADSAVRALLSDQLRTLLGANVDGSAVGNAISDAVTGLLTDAAVLDSLAISAGWAITTFLSRPGIPAAVTGTAAQIATAVLAGTATDVALQAALVSLEANSAVKAALGSTLGTAATTLLTDSAIPQALGEAVTAVIGSLAADPAVRALIADELAAAVAGISDQGPTAIAFGTAISGLANRLLANPAVLDALAAAAGNTVTTFLTRPGLSAVMTAATDQVTAALLAGGDPGAALQTALAGLQSDPAVQAAIGATLGAVATEILADPAVPQALGEATTILVNALATDPDIRAMIAEQLAEALSATGDLGPAGALVNLGALLTDPAVLDDLATIAGSTVATFLSQPGLSTALSAVAEQVAAALLSGADPEAVLALLQTNPQLRAAIGNTLPGFLNSVLGIDQLRQAVSAATGALITTALNDPALADLGIGAVSETAGAVADAVVDSLLANTAVGDLISEVAVDLLSGAPSSDTLNIVVDSILNDGAFQAAVGFAVGAGVGALFGDNLIGTVVGWVAGGAATLTIGLAAGITNLVLWLNPGFSLFPVAAASAVAAEPAGSGLPAPGSGPLGGLRFLGRTATA